MKRISVIKNGMMALVSCYLTYIVLFVTAFATGSAAGPTKDSSAISIDKKNPVDHSWGMDRLNLPPVWDSGLSGKGVKVGVIDSGFSPVPFNPNQVRVKRSYDFVPEVEASSPGFEPGDPYEILTTHGSSTIATIAARPGPNYSLRGVAPGVEVISYNIMFYDFTNGIPAGAAACCSSSPFNLSKNGYRISMKAATASILHAVKVEKVNILSMAFGFNENFEDPITHQRIFSESDVKAFHEALD